MHDCSIAARHCKPRFAEAGTAARITRARQREGEISSLELLDAERTVADAEATVAAGDAAIANAQVELFRALGGGWLPPATVSAAQA